MRIVITYGLACIGTMLLSLCCRSQSSPNDHAIVYSTSDAGTLKDTNRLFVIRDIIISGNEKTKPSIILREMPFQINQQYPLGTIVQKFRQARKQLMNTGLFRDVVVALNNTQGRDVYVSVAVEEKWFIWPQVFVRPVDKSFGEWWSEKNRNMDRINYGVRLSHNNISGRNDKLRVSLMNGYTQQLSAQYHGLKIDKALKWSTSAGISYGRNREVNYMTVDNRQVPVKSNNGFLHSYVGGFVQVHYRPAIKTTHTFGAAYTYESVADTIFKLNPSFSSDANIIQYPEVFYKLSYFDVDYIPYPTKGFRGELSLKKKGFGIKSSVNLWELSAKASQTWPLNSKYFFNLKGLGMLKLPFSQPYTGKQFIGYDGRYLQGYEYYVIDGVAGAYAKATISRPLVNTSISIPSQRFKSLNRIPIKIYGKVFGNTGYVYNTSAGKNQLTNAMLYSAGIGLDLLTIDDFVIKLEWSFNRIGENGIYFHQRNDF